MNPSSNAIKLTRFVVCVSDGAADLLLTSWKAAQRPFRPPEHPHSISAAGPPRSAVDRQLTPRRWRQARSFDAVAFVFKGPAKSTIIFGSEFAQQPHHPLNFPTLNTPTTLTYCVRFIPSPKHKLNFDFGIAQVAGYVIGSASTEHVNLAARHQAGFQISYGF